jgi:hypothetical protein
MRPIGREEVRHTQRCLVMSQYDSAELLRRFARPTSDYTNPREAQKMKRAIKVVLTMRHGSVEQARAALPECAMEAP